MSRVVPKEIRKVSRVVPKETRKEQGLAVSCFLCLLSSQASFPRFTPRFNPRFTPIAPTLLNTEAHACSPSKKPVSRSHYVCACGAPCALHTCAFARFRCASAASSWRAERVAAKVGTGQRLAVNGREIKFDPAFDFFSGSRYGQHRGDRGFCGDNPGPITTAASKFTVLRNWARRKRASACTKKELSLRGRNCSSHPSPAASLFYCAVPFPEPSHTKSARSSLLAGLIRHSTVCFKAVGSWQFHCYCFALSHFCTVRQAP